MKWQLKILEIVGDGLLLTSHPRYGKQLWALCELRRHKGDLCAICELPVGDYALRPISNAANRYWRICARHLPPPTPDPPSAVASADDSDKSAGG